MAASQWKVSLALTADGEDFVSVNGGEWLTVNQARAFASTLDRVVDALESMQCDDD